MHADGYVGFNDVYQVDQRAWLLGVGDFLGTVRDLRGRQKLLI